MRLLTLAAFALLLAACGNTEPLCVPGLSSPQSCAGMSDG